MTSFPSRVAVLGAGAQALETAAYCAEAGITVAGFVEEAPPPHRRDPEALGAPIRTFDEDLSDVSGLPALTAVGSPRVRRRFVERWHGTDFVTLVSSRAWVACDASIGAGSTVGPFAVVSRLAEIGRHAVVNYTAVVGHHARVGDFATVSPGTIIGGRVSIGSDVFFGMGARVLPGLRIGDGAYVGAGAVVTRDVPEGALVAGVPARPSPRPPDLG